MGQIPFPFFNGKQLCSPKQRRASRGALRGWPIFVSGPAGDRYSAQRRIAI